LAFRLAWVSPAPLPAHLADLMDKPEHFTVLPNDQSAIEAFIRKTARAAR
jgi:threonine synthase